MADPTPRVAIQYQGAPRAEGELAERVVSAAVQFEQGIGRDFHFKSKQRYRQYRGFRQFRDDWIRASPRDRDTVLYDAKKHWGAHLHIPLSYRTIETIVPRAIAHMPKILILPRDEQWRSNVEGVRLLLNAQQEQIDIDLPFQATMRSGRIYGLGVGKAYWRKEIVNRRRLKQSMMDSSKYVLDKARAQVKFDDPMQEDVDVFDFMWDPYGSSIETCEWVIHRVWMSTKAILNRLQEGVWVTQTARGLTEDKVRALGGGRQRYDEIWQERMEASGFSSYNLNAGGEGPHELLEYHDGERVLSVLDRQVLVQDQENPCCGEIPFQVYRPTPLQKQMVGIGDLEPLEHLQRELDTLRSQRRDAATIALCAGYAFDDAAIEEEDLVFGPAAAIRVTNARPQDAIMPLPIRDVPGSGYQEESIIRTDFEAVSGMQDALDNRPGESSSTATEAQLVQASLGRRIELSSRRFEIEVVRHVGRIFLYLDQRMITENRSALRVPEQHMTPEEAMEQGKWRWYPIGPGELEGEYELMVDGGSMAARNKPQDRADATQLMQMFGHSWYINPTKPLLRALELCDVKHPQSWLRDPSPPVPEHALGLLEQAGVDPALIQQAVLRARTISAPQEGPSAGDVSAMMGVSQAGAPQAAGAPR